MKNVLKLVLLVAIIALGYWAYRIPASSVEFQTVLGSRQKEIVQRLKDIREAQRAYKRNYSKYTGSFDTLINFLNTGTMSYERAMGSMDDSLAVARGLVKTETITVAIKDTIFSGRTVNFEELRYIPFTDKTEFTMGATKVETGSQITIPVFEAKVTYPQFLNDLGADQEVINLVDRYKSMDKFPGLMVGSLIQPNNDAGNWED